ncbi:MAG: PP2C family protein-serine/threonine phosphatase [Oscillospiraceae bacterium]
MKVTAGTLCGCNHRINEDSYECGRLTDGSHFAVLCDGMGGMSGGLVASSFVVNYLSMLSMKTDMGKVGNMREWMTAAMYDCNAELYRLSTRDTGKVTMGTTAIYVVVTGKKLYAVHSGDSRIYLIRSGKAERITTDHSIVQELLDKGRITEEQATKHPNRNIITSAIGVERRPRIDYHETDLEDGDTVLLCTDGLSNSVSEDEMVSILEASDFYRAADEMVRIGAEHGAQDDQTALLLGV